jgi:hypothetical protein
MPDKFVEDTDRLMMAIGSVVVDFQQLELWISEVLAMMLRIPHKEDQHLISASMSYGQKVDLFMELYPSRKPHGFSDIDLKVLRRALSRAEELRNRVVHSFWAVECDPEKARWIRIKGSLRGRKGFKLQSVAANAHMLEQCSAALIQIRDWYRSDTATIEAANLILDQHMDEELKS